MTIRINDLWQNFVLEYYNDNKIINFVKKININNMKTKSNSITIKWVKEIRKALSEYIKLERQRKSQEKDVIMMSNYFNSLIK